MANQEIEIYFGGSIRGGRDDVEIYTQVINLLGEYGKVLTEYIGDKKLTNAGELIDEKEIYQRDMDWLRRSTKRVFEVTNPSFGVGYEIGKAEEDPGSTLCIWRRLEGRKLSAMLVGNPKILVKEYSSIDDLKPIFDDFLRK